MKISYFKTVVNPEDIANPIHRDISTILNAIKNGQYKDVITEIRSKGTKEERDVIKKGLQAVLFAGTFSSRRADAFLKSSNIVCIDFDGIQGEELNSLRDSLVSDKYVYSVFISPSGKGIKALIKAPFDSYEEYKRAFCAIDDYFGQLKSFDMNCSDISRACYVSYDPELYINENSEVFIKKVPDYKEYTNKRRLASPEKTFAFLVKWMDSNGYSFSKGGRNHYLYVLASAMCRYGITDNDTEGLFIQRFSETDMSINEIKLVISSAYKRNEFGVVKMTDIHPDGEKEFYKKIEVPDLEFDPSCSTVHPDEINNEIFKILNNPNDYVSFGLKAMDKYLVFKDKEYYGIVAKSKSGKTQMVMYLLLLLAKNQNMIFLVLTTETAVSAYKLMMCSFLMDKPYQRATKEEVAKALDFIDDHFTFLDREIDHLQILDVYHYAVTQGINYNAILIDPISNVEESKRITKTGKDYYQELNRRYLNFCKKHCTIFNISHVVTYKEREDGVPSVQDAEYGAELARKVDVGLTFFRDSFNAQKKYITECHVKFQRTEYIRGGGTTMTDSPIEFTFCVGENRFGYDVTVDGLKYYDPLHCDNKRCLEYGISNADSYIEPSY